MNQNTILGIETGSKLVMFCCSSNSMYRIIARFRENTDDFCYDCYLKRDIFMTIPIFWDNDHSNNHNKLCELQVECGTWDSNLEPNPVSNSFMKSTRKYPGDKTSGLDLIGDCFLDLTNFCFSMNFDFLVSKIAGNGNRSAGRLRLSIRIQDLSRLTTFIESSQTQYYTKTRPRIPSLNSRSFDEFFLANLVKNQISFPSDRK